MVIYRKQYILSIVERKSLYTLIEKLPNKKATTVSKKMKKLLSSFVKHQQVNFKRITSDIRKEFSKRYLVAKKLKCKTYFCNPYYVIVIVIFIIGGKKKE